MRTPGPEQSSARRARLRFTTGTPASPYECYLPNARSRVLDERGRIQDIVNNYERLSWNFGPTLLAWISEATPDLLKALVAADRASLSRLGHGNAVAQAYNHMILPLATLRDRQTQIRWAVREFAHRFGRPPNPSGCRRRP